MPVSSLGPVNPAAFIYNDFAHSRRQAPEAENSGTVGTEKLPSDKPCCAAGQETAQAVTPTRENESSCCGRDSKETEEEQKKQKDQEAGPTPLAELTLEEQAQVHKLQQRDREVRAHEQAHVAAGGRYVRSGASFEYEKGPDGRQYAVGGEVSIDAGSVPGDPRASITKAQTVKRAALAPAKPSAQDRRVAAKASQAETKARAELAEMNREQAELAREQQAQKAEASAGTQATNAANQTQGPKTLPGPGSFPAGQNGQAFFPYAESIPGAGASAGVIISAGVSLYV